MADGTGGQKPPSSGRLGRGSRGLALLQALQQQQQQLQLPGQPDHDIKPLVAATSVRVKRPTPFGPDVPASAKEPTLGSQATVCKPSFPLQASLSVPHHARPPMRCPTESSRSVASSVSNIRQLSGSGMSLSTEEKSSQSCSGKSSSAYGKDSFSGGFQASSKTSSGIGSSSSMTSVRCSSESNAPSAAGVKTLGKGALVAQYILQSERHPLQEGPVRKAADTAPSSSCASDVPGEDVSSVLSSDMERLKLHEEDMDLHPPVVRKGTSGARFNATCNWLRVRVDTKKTVYEYAVYFQPEIDARNLRFKLLSNLKDQLGNTKSFDGAKLWLPERLKDQRTDLYTTHAVTGEPVRVRLDLKRRTSMADCVQLYNVLFMRVLRQLQMTKVGLSYYLPGERFLVPQHKLEIWPGYVTATHFTEGGVMLCVDTSHKVLRSTTAHEILSTALRSSRGNFEMIAKSAVVGSVVLTRYNNKTYIVDDIMFDQTPSSSFTNSKGETMTYIEYYKQHYCIDIKDPKQPLFVHKLKKKEARDMGECKMICLVPELCYMTGLTDEMRKDVRVMKDVAQYTRLSPAARQEGLLKFIRNINETPEAKKILSDWGLELDGAPLKLEGRILPPEAIQFGGRTVPAGELADFSREAARESVLVPVHLEAGQWVVVYTARDERAVNKFLETFQLVSRPLGIRMGPPIMARLPQDRIDAYVDAIRQKYSKNLQLAVVVFPSQREDRYSAVKKVACAELGLPTQCIVSRTINADAKLRSITLKIALQINCKLGGELWALKIPMQGLMVCGIDVYHDPSRRGCSVASFVSSTNATLTRWFSRASFQHPGDEIVNGLKVSFVEALKHYHQTRGELPTSIVVYRDGVSDGQLSLVNNHELPQLASVFRNFDGYSPKLTLVVVQKRINTRIYGALSGKGLNNPPPGSIIDHTITRRGWYDFLLVSQHVRQGAVSPTHYVVVHDGVGLKVDNLQRLTYKLTYLYYNWPGTIRVPAPCQYAHKLSYLVGQSVRQPTHDKLQDKLFYL